MITRYRFIHVPKTAGTSINKTLRYALAKRKLKPGSVPCNTIPFEHTSPSLFYRVHQPIHGHPVQPSLRDDTMNKDVRFITCIRHPVDRILSGYRYVTMGDIPLVEYIEDDSNWIWNVFKQPYSYFFKPSDIYFFIRFENLDKDWRLFCSDNNLPQIDLSNKNTKNNKVSILDSDIEYITDLYQDDIALYHNIINSIIY